MIARKKASEKMLLSNDKISEVVAPEIDPVNGERLEGLKLHDIQTNKRKQHGQIKGLNIYLQIQQWTCDQNDDVDQTP